MPAQTWDGSTEDTEDIEGITETYSKAKTDEWILCVRLKTAMLQIK